MKNLEQIKRYTQHYRFSDDDWQQVLEYCRKKFGGGKIHRALRPKLESTYSQFIDWICNGISAGDYVCYRDITGVVLSITPDKVVLAIYEINGQLVVGEMEIVDKCDIKLATQDKKQVLRRLMYENNFYFDFKCARLCKCTPPNKNLCVVYENDDSDIHGVGIFSKSGRNNYYFAGFWDGNEFYVDHKITIGCTPLFIADSLKKSIFKKAMKKAGYMYHPLSGQIKKEPKCGTNNVYWYMNDRFEIVQDRDNGARKHISRFKSGNYFSDYTEALLFCRNIKKMRDNGL